MSIYQHFRQEEHHFIDQILSWKDAVEHSYITKRSDFLDPREQHITQSILGGNHDVIHWDMYGGVQDAERKRLIIRPFYESLEKEEFQCVLLQATYHQKFMNVSHPDVLGAFLSLGLERNKLGDIFVGDGIIQIIVSEDIRSYILANFTSVKRANVTFETGNINDWKGQQHEWSFLDRTISSKRLDVLVKEMYQIPRKEAVQAIQRKFVRVNFKVIENPAFEVEEGDLFSVRGKGRGYLRSINGKTRKDRLRITVGLLK